ncbi:glycoside hydrolase family 26 protein [Hymenobacter nivis]|uniref:Mannan endo-1,4-beta-mannosidase n=1 Tax=Hymenobacter nivis TaxID=1850093 RepID=A0A2Z3GH88_9BACT|nr:glycosyl hydrolase [Hymenobacter nivis]AWM31551.1 beta-mannosidase [Hymenobacter nivis]
MNFRNLTLGLTLAAALLAGRAQAQSAPADPAATPETKRLLSNLHKLLDKGVMFGHQDDMAYGLTPEGQRWIGEPGRSDVKSVTGSYPAVFGWELGHVELDSARSLDAVPFAKIREYIKQVYAQGGVNTISWHLDNPHDGKSAWDTTRTVSYILPGGEDHAKYVTYLDRLGTFLATLKGTKGEAIPVIFRPFHEHTGSWFWWGEKNCTPAQYKQLYEFTINYLRDTKKLHNLLIAYSPSDVETPAHYLERYPGDGYVDVLGFDVYYHGDGSAFKKTMATNLTILTEVAREHHKLPALTETGLERLPDANWWTKTLLPTIAGYKLSYVLVWRNGRPDHYYAPYPGQASAADFKTFAKDKKVLLEKQLAPLKIYSKTL